MVFFFGKNTSIVEEEKKRTMCLRILLRLYPICGDYFLTMILLYFTGF